MLTGKSAGGAEARPVKKVKARKLANSALCRSSRGHDQMYPSFRAGAGATTSMAEFFGMCVSGDLPGVQAALSDPALSGALDQNLWSGVHHATKHGHTEVLEALLGACAAVLN